VVPLEHAATVHAIAAKRILPARIQPVSQGDLNVAADFHPKERQSPPES